MLEQVASNVRIHALVLRVGLLDGLFNDFGIDEYLIADTIKCLDDMTKEIERCLT